MFKELVMIEVSPSNVRNYSSPLLTLRIQASGPGIEEAMGPLQGSVTTTTAASRRVHASFMGPMTSYTPLTPYLLPVLLPVCETRAIRMIMIVTTSAQAS